MMCNCCNTVLYSGSIGSPQTVAAGGSIAFDRNMSIGTQQAGNGIVLKKPGLYQVVVDVSAASTADAAANLEIALRSNGIDVYNASSLATPTSTTDNRTMAITAIVKVNATTCPVNDNSVTLTVVNIGSPGLYNAGTITVVRV